MHKYWGHKGPETKTRIPPFGLDPFERNNCSFPLNFQRPFYKSVIVSCIHVSSRLLSPTCKDSPNPTKHSLLCIKAEEFEEIATMDHPFEGIPTVPPRKDFDRMVRICSVLWLSNDQFLFPFFKIPIHLSSVEAWSPREQLSLARYQLELEVISIRSNYILRSLVDYTCRPRLMCIWNLFKHSSEFPSSAEVVPKHCEGFWPALSFSMIMTQNFSRRQYYLSF